MFFKNVYQNNTAIIYALNFYFEFFKHTSSYKNLSSCCEAIHCKTKLGLEKSSSKEICVVPAQMLTAQSWLSRQLLSIFEEPCYPWTNQLHSEKITHSNVGLLLS